ncbi:MAG: phosphoribosylglycinamide formyltransferase [Thermodesulfobacteriota bacterium]
MTLDLAVLVSGGGSNLQSIIDKVEAGVLDARIRVVFSNKPEAFGLERARRSGIPHASFLHTEFPDRESFDREVVRVIREHGADTIALAGYMRLLTPWFLEQFPGRVINIHPALLPSFPGVHGQADAASYGVKLSGCTVHFVDEKMDHGPAIIQAAVPAHPEDDGSTLGARILEYEHRIYPQALQWFAEGRLSVQGRKVALKDAGRPKARLHAPALVNPPLEEGF